MHKSESGSSLGPGGLDLTQAFFRPIHNAAPPSPTKRHTKISVIGTGNVGMAVAQTILTQDLADELALVDAIPTKLRGEMLDLQHAAAFLPRTKILASTDYSVTAGSDLFIVTAGARQVVGESRLNLLQRNVSLFEKIVPPLAKYSPDAILMVVSNPVDVLTHVAWKLSGFPPNRVVGSGTNLDSSRFRFLIADHLDVNAQDVQAFIVGEHGDSSVALWSSISVGGVPILTFLKSQQIAYEKETLENIHKEVINSAYEVISLKGYTSWAIGYSAANLARSILRDQRSIHPVSVLARGFHGIDGDVFLSLPAQLGRGGILGVTNVHLTEEEAKRLRESAKTILEVQSQLGLWEGTASSGDRLPPPSNKEPGWGLPVGKHIVPNKPLPVNEELLWDNGTPFPEPCIDRIADTVGKYEALGWLCGGLSFLATLGLLAVWNDKASKIPFAPKVYPYDNLRVELGGEP